MFGVISRWIRHLTARYPRNARALVIREALKGVQAASLRGSAFTVAVQCLEDPFYFGLFGAICQRLRNTAGAVAELVVVRSISGAVGTGWQQRLGRFSVVGLVVSAQWIRAFRGVIDRVAYRSLSLAHPLADLLDWLRSYRIWRSLKGSTDITGLEVLGVPTGDLLNDSYLRFRPAPRFDSTDWFVIRLIWQAHRDVRRARKYFSSRRPHVYLTSYATYLEHGIPARVALQEGVRVYSFGNFVQIGKELSLSDWFHTPDTSSYRATFESLENKAERLALAEQQLNLRLSGEIDTATSYMRVSAYSPTSEPLPDVAAAVIVFLHDFYDSPHVYQDLVFPDFWSWACFTIDTLQSAGIKFYAKPHPNQVSRSSEALEELAKRYPGLPLLSERITNVQLAAAGILCGVTVYGSVSHELAYLSVPTIACARHPHHAFDFCRTARTVEQYRRYLLTPEQVPLTKEEMRRQALAFYYMHNLHGDAEVLSLRQRFVSFWKTCNTSTVSDAVLTQSFQELCDSPPFMAHIERICVDFCPSWKANTSAGLEREPQSASI